MKATFENSVNVLVKAYLNDTLQHCNCHACAVGNLVADVMCLPYTKRKVGEREIQTHNLTADTEGPGGQWYSSLMNYRLQGFLARKQDVEEGNVEIQKIGYTLDEVHQIETAFERGAQGTTEDERMFNSLTAVVDVLAKIHNVDLFVREEAKQLFEKPVLA